jgi:phosphoribosylaminoimidazole (AIR) synthetase
MVLIVPQEEAKEIISRLQGMQFKSYIIGDIVKRKDGEKPIIFV